jgi:hypothetical protein
VISAPRESTALQKIQNLPHIPVSSGEARLWQRTLMAYHRSSCSARNAPYKFSEISIHISEEK